MLLVNVRSCPHLGHVITTSLDDSEDILQRRNCFIGQGNSLVRFFDKLSWTAKLSPFKAVVVLGAVKCGHLHVQFRPYYYFRLKI